MHFFIPPFDDPTSSMVPCLSTFLKLHPFQKLLWLFWNRQGKGMGSDKTIRLQI